MKIRTVVASLALATISMAAVAGPECTKAPSDQWMSEAAMKEKIAADGYTIAKFKKTSGNCYEIYGHDKLGKKVEIYFNPVNGSIVKQKREG